MATHPPGVTGSQRELLFVIDPPEHLKPAKDSSIAMMRELGRRGHAVWVCTPRDLTWLDGAVRARALPIALSAALSAALRAPTLPEAPSLPKMPSAQITQSAPSAPSAPNAPGAGHLRTDPQPLRNTGGSAAWYVPAGPAALRSLATFAGVLMRKDPPFDAEYLYATHLLGAAVRNGARVFNDPAALRNHNEKLAITEFTQFIAPTLVSSDAREILAFHGEQGEIVVKPLDGMGGSGIFRVAPGDPNTNAILETVTCEGGRTVMAQRFLPAIAQGDKRILLIGGRPVPFALARVPKAGESRGNLAAGGTGHARPLTVRDRQIAETLGPVLDGRGLLLVGLDVIGDHLTEINVTSPTCFVEITQQSGFDVAAAFADALLARLDA